MKSIIIILLCVFLSGCAGRIPGLKHNPAFEDGYHFGVLNKALLQNHDAYTWFPEHYDTYSPNLKRFDLSMLNKTEIKVFMGTWCHDSQREVPRLYKILDDLNYDDTKSEIIGLKKDKTGYFKDYSHFDIQKTPTIIFYQDDQEIGRIIEEPKGSLEAHIQQILTDKK